MSQVYCWPGEPQEQKSPPKIKRSKSNPKIGFGGIEIGPKAGLEVGFLSCAGEEEKPYLGTSGTTV